MYFKPHRRYVKNLNLLEIKGCVKGGFLKRSIGFDIIVYFTPVKKSILEVVCECIDINDERLGFNFKLGDNISLVRQWVIKNNFIITCEIDRD